MVNIVQSGVNNLLLKFIPTYMHIVVGLRVNLSSCELFTDLMLQLWRNLHGARCHAHYPFATIADEVSILDKWISSEYIQPTLVHTSPAWASPRSTCPVCILVSRGCTAGQ